MSTSATRLTLKSRSRCNDIPSAPQLSITTSSRGMRLGKPVHFQPNSVGRLGLETGRTTASMPWSQLQMPTRHRSLRRRTSVGRDRLLLEVSSDEACVSADTMATSLQSQDPKIMTGPWPLMSQFSQYPTMCPLRLPVAREASIWRMSPPSRPVTERPTYFLKLP